MSFRISSLALALALASALHSQTPTATLQGLVHDPSGAAAPQARVVVKNLLTGVSNAVDTNGEGRYVVPFLRLGSYEVIVEKVGFRRFAQTDITPNVEAFSISPAFTFGNAPGTLPNVREPGLRNCDLSMFKNSRLVGDRLTTQFRVEAFNALNTPQFARAGSSIGSSAAGTITSLRVPTRQIQLALKVIF